MRRRGGTPGVARRRDDRSRPGAGRAADGRGTRGDERPPDGRGPIGVDGRSTRVARWRTDGRAVLPAGRGHAGSALVESLVALVLVAIAGALVASAAQSGLRAAARAATLVRASALAGRELARVAGAAANATAGETMATLAVTGFPEPVVCTTDVARDDAVVTLAVDVVAGRPSERVSLATRRFVAPPAGQ